MLEEECPEEECPPPPTARIGIKIFRACKPDSDSEDADYDEITIEVPESEAANIKELHDRIFELQSAECRNTLKSECYAAIPEWWQVRLGADRPQLIVQYAEVLNDGKFGAPKYALTIPHYSLSFEQTTKDLFPNYQKGQAMGVLTLADNSKLIVNCNTQSEAESLIEALSESISSEALEGSFLSTGNRKGQRLKTITVAPRIAKFFATGQKDIKPDWVRYFKDE